MEKLKKKSYEIKPSVCMCVYVFLLGHRSCLTDLFLLVVQLELDGKLGCVHLLLSPDQVTHLMDLLAALCIDTGTIKLTS